MTKIASVKVYLLVKSGVRARVYGMADEFDSISAAQEVADRLNYKTSSTRWGVEEMLIAH